MKKIYFLLLFSFGFITVNAQIEVKEDTAVNGWKRGGFLSFSFNQVALQNWAAGGESALSATVLGNYFWKYRKNDLYF